MELSLIHAGLAAGAALAAVPVILHLFMRQTPKHVIFPAIRLIRERQKRSRKRMKIKNWLLLAARMALLALMALALARPRLHSDMPLGDESVPTALGLVFDTSLSMSYKENDKTLLDQAKDRAREIIGRIPDSSLVFAVNSADPGVPVGLSPSAARKWIDNLTIRPVNRPLNVATGQVYPAVAECDRPRHEVYILTDLSRSSWNPDRPAEGLDRAKQVKGAPAAKIATFVLRVGSQEFRDVAIDEVALSSTTATQGEPLEVRGVVRALGPNPVSPIVEFYLDGVKKGNQPVEIPAGGQAEVRFTTPPRLKEGEVHRVELRLSGAPDALKFNDERYLSFGVRPALKVLLVADQTIDADYVASALDPSPGALKSFELELARPAELVVRYRDTLKDFAAVFLLNVATLDESAWGLLNGYVHEGGGLVVGLGDRCQPKNYNGPTAAQVLPAQLDDPPHAPPGGEIMFGKILDVTHPLFERFAKEFDSQFAVMPVFRYWKLKTTEASRALLSFADGAPALVERTFRGAKTGRVLLWSTPLARRPGLNDRARWNEFPDASYWAFPVLMNLTVPYLAGATSDQLNFEAGDDVVLNLKPDARYQNFLVTGPDEKTTERLSPPVVGDPLKITAPQHLGQWTVTALGPDNQKTMLGFSLNPPRSESVMTRLEPAELDAMFGKDGYALADDPESLKKLIDVVRVGHEIFPWLMMLILLLVTAENFLANTFYKEPPAPTDAGKAKAAA
ncbi:BatA domain-containing protein [Paludisphaera borealis]|uniref:Aerotolerance regulator N-terminal domain-containing protein n=1 Tax=Paludisphaera borealis TaxID=1387353 RepID=A0A1U7CY28_9BACT|nr:BatA domain-containing protein [Paludisphaera borealis]APW63798.1 hypothetical protein BSF38_05375 [Paludisphaera borealis]